MAARPRGPHLNCDWFSNAFYAIWGQAENKIAGTMNEVMEQRGNHWLVDAGLRPTRQRLALATLLVGDGENRHVTAESLYEAAQAAGESVSLATVYNTLKAFCDAGLLREITIDGSKSYFDTDISDHPHYYWEDTGAFTDAPVEELQIRNLPPAPTGSKISGVDVVIRLRRT